MSIQLLRLNTCDNITFENVTLYTLTEQRNIGIPDLFENEQICWVDAHGHTNIASNSMVSAIAVRKMKPTNELLKVRRICITHDQITFSPAWVIRTKLLDKYGVPVVYNKVKQFCFVADGMLYITKDDKVALVELER